ncbi:hypothetical protein C8F04DRAFT_896763, partial [Mycena alexandri]
RCLDCHAAEFICDNCMLQSHAHIPLHQIQRYHNGRFSTVGLKNIGMRIALTHLPCDPCPIPVPENHFIIVDTDRAHNVAIDFCGCGKGGTRAEQLVAARLYPCSYERPRAAISFRM